MILEINNNIIFAPEKLIIHGCNCQGKMGAGVAKALRNRFPLIYDEYYKLYKSSGLILGTVQFVYIPKDNKYIGNCMTQFFYGFSQGPYATYIAVEQCLQITYKFCKDNNISSVAMPKIGCNLGGLEWDKVRPIIDFIFRDITAVIYCL